MIRRRLGVMPTNEADIPDYQRVFAIALSLVGIILESE
jgi:hypothetical protein